MINIESDRKTFQMRISFLNFISHTASGQKLIVIHKKGNSNLTNKSQTLPRSMGSRVPSTSEGARPQRLPTKPATTPPVIRRQFSVNILKLKLFFCFMLRFSSEMRKMIEN